MSSGLLLMSGAQLINTPLSVDLITHQVAGTTGIESDTGYTYNGKTVYTKTYTGTCSATDGAVTLDTITGLSHIVRFYGYWIRSYDGVIFPFNRVQASTSNNSVIIRRTGLDIEVYSSNQYNSSDFRVSVFYTK